MQRRTAEGPANSGYDPPRPDWLRPRVDRSALSSSLRNLRSLRQTPLPRPTPETTSFVDAEPWPGSDASHPMSTGYGPAGWQARQIAEANERSGATTSAGYIEPSKAHPQPAGARTQPRKPDQARRRNRRSTAIRRCLSRMQPSFTFGLREGRSEAAAPGTGGNSQARWAHL